MEEKWRIVDTVINEIEGIKQQEDGPEARKLDEISNKLIRLKALRENIIKDENQLKLQYLILMRERNVYFEKLKMIQTVGEDNEWQDSDGLLQGIMKTLYSFGQKNSAPEGESN